MWVLAVAAAQAFDGRIIGVGIAIHAKQRPARRFLRLEALGAHVAGLQIDVAVGDAEHGDIAFAIERDVVGEPGWILEIRSDAIERAVDGARNFAIDFAVANVDLAAKRRREAAEHRILAKCDWHYARARSTRILVPS